MPMYSLMFLAFALAQLGLFIWLLGIYRRSRAPGALVLLVPQFFLIWDNLRVAAGIVMVNRPAAPAKAEAAQSQ